METNKDLLLDDPLNNDVQSVTDVMPEPVTDVMPGSVPVSEPVNKSELDLLKLIGTFVNDKKLRIKLRSNEIKMINLILEQNPEFLRDLQEPLKKIFQDNAITVEDIPQMMILIRQISKLNSKKLKMKTTDVILLINTILIIIVESDYFLLKGDKESYINIINSITDILLSTVPEKNLCLKCKK